MKFLKICVAALVLTGLSIQPAEACLRCRHRSVTKVVVRTVHRGHGCHHCGGGSCQK